MHALSRRISEVLDLDPSGRAIEYNGHWYTWGGQLAKKMSRQIATVVQPGARVGGVLLRNTPATWPHCWACCRPADASW